MQIQIEYNGRKHLEAQLFAPAFFLTMFGTDDYLDDQKDFCLVEGQDGESEIVFRT